jgi:hypothetical protein
VRAVFNSGERQVKTRAMPSAADFEASLFKQRDDVQTWRVYADLLQASGDVRGELISLALKDEAAAQKKIDAIKADLLTPELVKNTDQVYGLKWKYGHLERASLKGLYDGEVSLEDLTRSLLSRPITKFIRTLQFGLASYESDNDWSETFSIVADAEQGKTLEELLFNDYTYEDSEISWTAFGDFSPFWKKVPNLRTLHIRSGEGGELGDIDLPELRMFVRESGGLARAEIAQICKARWPKLEHLEIWFGQDNYGGDSTPDDVADILAGRGLPALKHLGLVNGEFPNDLIEPVAKSAVLPRLTSLSFAKSTLDDAGAETLLKHAAAFKHLKAIDLTENYLSAEAIQRVQAVLPSADTSKQRTDDDPEYRYSVVGE